MPRGIPGSGPYAGRSNKNKTENTGHGKSRPAQHSKQSRTTSNRNATTGRSTTGRTSRARKTTHA